MTNMQQHQQQQQQQQQPSAPQNQQNQQNQQPPQSASPTGSPDNNNNTNSGAHQGDGQFRHQLEILSKLGAANPAAGAVAQPRGPQQPAPGPSPHGYANGASSPAPDGLPASNNDPEAHIHPDLRARTAFAPVTNMMASGMPPPAVSPSAPSAGPSVPPPIQPQHQQPQLQPQPPPDMGGDPMSIDDTSPDGRKAKRELSQSKRAAQNRAAQRAFRQRKEGYIKKLEQQVRDYMEMESQYKQLQSESYALREYVIHLQSRMLDTQGEYPQPPPNVNLNQPPPPHLTQGPPAHQLQGPDGLPSPQGSHAIPEQQHLSHPPQEQEPVPQQPLPTSSAPAPPASDSAVGTPLEAVAQAVAGLAAQEQMAERQSYAAGKEYRPEPDAEVKHDAEADRQREEGMQAPTASM